MAQEVVAIAQQVRELWLSQNLHVQPVSTLELRELRGKCQVIPAHYEQFLVTAGLPRDMDARGYEFWRPRRIRATSEVLQEAGSACAAREPSMVIADYLHESWWYVLWLAGPDVGSVSLAGRGEAQDPLPPMGTFTEFLVAYLNDDERMLGAPWRSP